MKTRTINVYSFDELNEKARNKAINDRINDMLEYESEDHYKNWPEFKKACDKAEQMQTPWFTGSYVWEYCKEGILSDLKENEWEYDEDGNII